MRAAAGTATGTVLRTPPERVVLALTADDPRHVTFAPTTVDNEGLDKRKSKCEAPPPKHRPIELAARSLLSHVAARARVRVPSSWRWRD